jgi:hypothetical protein
MMRPGDSWAAGISDSGLNTNMNEQIPGPVDFKITDEDLHKVLTEIDTELRASSDRVFGRELRGWMAFCKKFGLAMAMHDPLAVRIYDWFTRQYGDRLKNDMAFGNTVVEIRKDFYSLRVCRCYGRGKIFCDPTLPAIPPGGVSVNQPFTSRLFEQIDGLTPEFIKSMTSDECNNILDTYARGFLGLSRMLDVEGAPYSKEAYDDLLQSAAHLVSKNPNYGFSRWSSLQAAEKTLKSFTVQSGGKLELIHKLADLEKQAVAVGLPVLPPNLLADIQCSPKVRYEAHTATKAEALKAHYAALELCARVAPLIKGQSGWMSSVSAFPYKVRGIKSPIKMLLVARGMRPN